MNTVLPDCVPLALNAPTDAPTRHVDAVWVAVAEVVVVMDLVEVVVEALVAVTRSTAVVVSETVATAETVTVDVDSAVEISVDSTGADSVMVTVMDAVESVTVAGSTPTQAHADAYLAKDVQA